MNRGHAGEDDDSHRARSDQRRGSEGQKNAHAPLHGDDHGQTPRAEKKAPNQAQKVPAHRKHPPHLKVRPEDTDHATGAAQRIEEDKHPIDQGQTEQAQVHAVLKT